MPVLRSSTDAGPPASAISAAPGSVRVRPRRPPTRPRDGVDAGDRRIVTALFADLVDYVRMLAEHDPEEVRARVGRALGRMAMRSSVSRGRARSSSATPSSRSSAGRMHTTTTRSGRPWRHWRSGRCCSSRTTAASRSRSGSASPPARWWLPRAATARRRPGGDRRGDHDRGAHPVDWPGRARSCSTRRRCGRPATGWPSTIVARSSSAASRGRSGCRTDAARSGLADPVRTGRRPARARRSDDGGGPRSARPQAGAALGPRCCRARDRRRCRHGQVAPRWPIVEAEARALGFAWTWTENVSYGRGEPYRFGRPVRPGPGRRARHRFGQLCAPTAVHAGHRRGGGAALRRRDRRDRSRCGVLGLGGGGGQRAGRSGRDVARDPGRGRRGIRRSPARDRRAAGGRPRRPPLARSVEHRDGRAPRHGRRGPARSSSSRRHGPARCPSWAALPITSSSIELDGLEPRRDGAARDDRRARRARRGRRPARSTSERRATRCSSARPSAPRSRTAPSIARRPDGARRAERAAPAADPAGRARRTHRRPRRAARDVLGVASVIGIAFRPAELEALLGEPIPPGALDRLVGRRAHRPVRSERDVAVQPPARPRRGVCRAAGSAPATAPRPPRRPTRGGAPRARSRRSRSTARPPAMPPRAIPLLVEAASAALALGAANEAAAFWRNAAELASDPTRSRASVPPPTRRWRPPEARPRRAPPRSARPSG